MTFLFFYTQEPLFPELSITVKGPDGYAFLGILLLLFLPVFVYFLVLLLRNKNKRGWKGIFPGNNLNLSLEKNKHYFPDIIKLKVVNTGETDIDLDVPVLTFSRFIINRNFRLKGTNQYHFYPLLLEPGKVHDLAIDLKRFYRYDNHLRGFPRISVMVRSLDGKNKVKKSVRIRKTLFS